ncbi:uncharacterized protein VICG_01757 [Vittaforma corneae ATCC 50505]|uniref:Uncharacterized protein n=1 Tax=Vittaforma corneae (strain ATCC 50505) TaxID=993615 RepID=L2GJV9_VITCO|nr:uncharacterized protein VICG_01757 [Vittaforma corneae ATCC 50505]ELA41158.1 hypothetical protein VICG_01757 [Vittaforma corneae ATCC 50505]
MVFFLYTFSSDYLKERFISMENCSLLSSSLPKAMPKIFFTRDLHKDCECEILVVETLKKDIRAYKRTQKLAKTVLITATPFTSLDAFLSLGINCKLVCMSKEEVLFSTASSLLQEEETEIQRFSRNFGIEKSHELGMFSSLLDVGMLKKRLWLIGSIKNTSEARIDGESNTRTGNAVDSDRSSSPCSRELSFGSEGSIQYDCWQLNNEYSDGYNAAPSFGHSRAGGSNGRQTAPILGSHVVNKRPTAFAYRYIFKSSTDEPSEHQPIRNTRPRGISSKNRRKVSLMNRLLCSEAENTDSHMQINQPFYGRNDHNYFCVFNDDHLFGIRGVAMNGIASSILNISAAHNLQKKRKRMHRRARPESEYSDYSL